MKGARPPFTCIKKHLEALDDQVTCHHCKHEQTEQFLKLAKGKIAVLEEWV